MSHNLWVSTDESDDESDGNDKWIKLDVHIECQMYGKDIRTK